MKFLPKIELILHKSLYIWVILVTTANAQIMYNKAKPVSLESQSFKQLQELPIIDFPVDENGSMFQSSLNVDVKKNALFESAKGKNIARLMIKVNAKSLGNITINFKDVLLNNNSYCLVYTQDQKIVAGPIYQKSINNKQFTIMNIPASELILEVIYKNKADFTLKLNEVSFASLVNLKEAKKKEKKINQEKFLSGSCDNLGVVGFKDNILNLKKMDCSSGIYNSSEGCEWLGANNLQMNDIKTFSKFNSINDIGYTDFKATRSTCNFMLHWLACPLDSIYPDSLRFSTNNATLINFPSVNCGDSYIIVAAHQVGAYGIDSLQNSQHARDNAIVRFNYHYKYGTPEHLFNVICKDNVNNFNLWRSTINFDEVIDYQGVEIFAMDDAAAQDFIILKMNCKPFYKENHLGWTKQTKFDTQYNYIGHNELHSDYHYLNSLTYKPFADNTFIIGSRTGATPKLILSNYFTFDNNYVIADENEIFSHPSGSDFNYSGYSGSCIFYKNYLNSGSEVALGIMDDGDRYVFFNKSNFKNILDKNISVPPSGYSSISEYFTANSFNPLFNSEIKNILHHKKNGTTSITAIDTFRWYPSMSNKEKCPSPVATGDSCDFDINDYTSIVTAGDSVCISISQIPSSKFPDQNNIPKGYRIYHNFGEQKTLKWESFQDNQDITFPIEFCLSKCEMLDLLAIGRDGLDIGIDFYDESGNVYNNIGCDTASIYYEFPTFCELFDVNIQKIDSSGACCTYKIDLTIDYELGNLLDCSANPNIRKLLDSIYFKSSLELEPFRIQETDSLTFDTLNGLISFQYTPCPDSIPTNTSFKFYVSNNGVMCEIDSIDFPSCACNCPTNANDWVDIIVNSGEPPCSPDECKFIVNIDIPSLEGQCYKYYKIDDEPILKPLPPNGEILFTPSCIYKGESKDININLYVDGPFSDSCLITKSIICPLVDEKNICTPDCPESEWKDSISTMQVPGCTDCNVRISYVYRKVACYNPPRQDLQINKLETFSSNPSNPDACGLCTIDIKELYQRAIKQLILDNPMDFHPIANEEEFPNPEYCDTTWRIVQNSCWAQIPLGQYGTVENPTPNFAIVPCDSSECCMVELEVCRWGSPRKINISVLTTWNELDSCDSKYFWYHNPHVEIIDTSVFPPDFVMVCCSYAQCHSTCEDWLNDLDTMNFKGYFKSSIDNDNDDNRKIEINGRTKLIQNYDKIDLEIYTSKEAEIAYISLYNLHGKVLYSSSIELKNGTNHLIINSSALPTGLYFLNINLDGTQNFNHKFIIIK